MSETTVGRRPLTVVDIQTPRCVNKFGCLPCQGGLGQVADCAFTVKFAQVGLNSEFVGTSCTISRIRGGLNVAATGANSYIQALNSSATFDGSLYRYVVVHGKINSSLSDFSFTVSYGNDTDGPSADQEMQAVNISSAFRGVTLNTIAAGSEFVAVFDAADSNDYATAWDGRDIETIRVEISADSDLDYDIYSISVCENNLYSSKATACYNNRGSCQSVRHFRSRPDGHRDPDVIKGNGETIASTELTRDGNLAFAVDLRFKSTPSGVIWEQGGTTQGVYLGITGSNLVFRAGDGSVSDGVNVAKISTAFSAVAGITMTLLGEIDFDSGSITLWWWCPCNFTLTLIGTDSAASGFPSVWADSDDGMIGGNGGSTIATGEDGGDFNGTIAAMRFYSSSLADIIGTETWSRHLYLSEGTQEKPTDEIYIIPTLLQVSTVGSRINLAGSDRNYEPLGRRATLDFSCGEFQHSDFQQDDYLSDRAVDPFTLAGFWGKWCVREKYGRVQAFTTVYDGYHGQALADMQSRKYILDSVEKSGDYYSFHCRDILSRTEFVRAQVPPPSSGKLKTAMAASGETVFEVAFDVTEEYPASGTVRMNDEIITYSGRTYDPSGRKTIFTIDERASDGSTAATHSVDELVQVCRRYTAARIDDVAEEWLVDDANIQSQLIDLATFTSEYDDVLSAYTVTTLITEPTSVSLLLGQLSQECSFYVWWDERDQIVSMQAIKPLSTVDLVLTDSNIILRDSLSISERPDERLTTVAFYYNPRNWAGDLDKASNFKNGIVVLNTTTVGLNQYGVAPQIREVYSRFLTTEAMANQTSSRLSIRYADVPQYVQFMLDAKDRDLWVGDFVRIEHRDIVKADGTKDTQRRWLIVEAEETVSGHAVRYVAADVTLDGKIYLIADNGTANYHPDTYDETLIYITDEFGLNADGTIGFTIG